MKNFILSILFSLLSLTTIWAQATDKKKEQKQNYAKDPVWMDMMEDPNVNYFEAVQAFEQFWEGREKPEIKDEEEYEEEHKKNFFERLFESEKKEMVEKEKYAIPYKRFLKWKMESEPFVQPDGHVLSLEEQRLIWEQSRQ